MNEITLTAEELKTKAMAAMENAIALLRAGLIYQAARYSGMAWAYEELLNDLGVFFEEEDEDGEYYNEMKAELKAEFRRSRI